MAKHPVTILFIIFCVYNIHNAVEIYYPEEMLNTASDIDVTRMQCPSFGDNIARPSWATGDPKPFFVPRMSQHILVNGYICETMEITTTCEEGWFWGTSMKKDIRIIKSNDRDCIMELERYRSGMSDVAMYPEVICHYASMNTEKVRYISIKSMNLPYDPYTGKIVSNYLLNQNCDQVPCLMKNSLSLWVIDHNSNERCTGDDINEVGVWFKEIQFYSPEQILWSHDITLGKLKSACTLNFCNKVGLRFPSGDWLGITGRLQDSDMKFVKQFIPVCDLNSKINNNNMNSLMDHKIIVLAEENRQSFCLQTKVKMLEGHNVSRSDLQDFIPKRSGQQPVYFFSNGRIRESIGKYVKIQLNKTVVDGVIGKTMDGKDVSDTLFNKPNTFNIRDGPNGLFIHNGVMVYKYSTKDYDLAELNSDMHLQVKIYNTDKQEERISLTNVSILNHPSEEKKDKVIDLVPTSVKEAVSSFRFIKYIIWFLCVIMLCGILYKVYTILCKFGLMYNCLDLCERGNYVVPAESYDPSKDRLTVHYKVKK